MQTIADRLVERLAISSKVPADHGANTSDALLCAGGRINLHCPVRCNRLGCMQIVCSFVAHPCKASTTMYIFLAACFRAEPPRAYLLTQADPSFLISAMTWFWEKACSQAPVALQRSMHQRVESLQLNRRLRTTHVPGSNVA
jgi:hypothetical protein